MYHVKVVQDDQTTKYNIGNTSTDFKSRLAVHKQSLKNPDINQTSLSKHILELKIKKTDFTLTVCTICNLEKVVILFRPELADINSKSELYSNCRHKQSILLVPKEIKRRRRVLDNYSQGINFTQVCPCQ